MGVDEAHAALLRNDRLQFDLPDAQPIPTPQPSWFPPLWVGSTLGWVIVAIACLLALLVVWHVWRNRPPTPATAPTAAGDPVVIRAEVARATLAAADALAAEGRFAEAAHALLACGIDEIRRLYPNLLRPATTSRDLAGLATLPGLIRLPFARIATIVELGIFGNRPIAADGYADCRQAFVTSALAGRA